MYIPTGLIIGAIILGIYFFAKAKKQNPTTITNNNMPEIFKDKFSESFVLRSISVNLHSSVVKPVRRLNSEKVLPGSHITFLTTFNP